MPTLVTKDLKRWTVQLPNGHITVVHPGVLLNPDASHNPHRTMLWSCQHVSDSGQECHEQAHYRHESPRNWSIGPVVAQTNSVAAASAGWCRTHVPAGGYHARTGRRVAFQSRTTRHKEGPSA